MLIVQVILFLLLHENCGCCGNRNSQNVAKTITYGSRHIKNFSSLLDETWYVNSTGGIVLIMHIILL